MIIERKNYQAGKNGYSNILSLLFCSFGGRVFNFPGVIVIGFTLQRPFDSDTTNSEAKDTVHEIEIPEQNAEFVVLPNLGNTCFMNAVVQLILSVELSNVVICHCQHHNMPGCRSCALAKACLGNPTELYNSLYGVNGVMCYTVGDECTTVCTE